MKNASQYRALASLFRQQAAYNPARKWHLLGQAERWEHLAAQDEVLTSVVHGLAGGPGKRSR